MAISIKIKLLNATAKFSEIYEHPEYPEEVYKMYECSYSAEVIIEKGLFPLMPQGEMYYSVNPKTYYERKNINPEEWTLEYGRHEAINIPTKVTISDTFPFSIRPDKTLPKFILCVCVRAGLSLTCESIEFEFEIV